MSQVQQFDPKAEVAKHAISMTDAAKQHVQQRMAKQGHGIGIRLGIKKSGCSGYAYTVDIIDSTAADDYVFTISEDILVCVDAKHWPILKGTELDYIREGINQRFHYNNPNETGGCGCGESFTVDEV